MATTDGQGRAGAVTLQQVFTVALRMLHFANQMCFHIFPMISKVYILQQLYTGSERNTRPAYVSSSNSLNVTAVHKSLVWEDSVLLPTFLQCLETKPVRLEAVVQCGPKLLNICTSWSSVCPHTMVTCLCFLKPSFTVVYAPL